MRLSDAIALGRTLVNPKECGRGAPGNKPEDGCALDMAVLAVGGNNWHQATKYWPWLHNIDPEERGLPLSGNFYFSIIRQFDRDVMLLKRMTLDQLIDWVRSIEPPEQEQPQPVIQLESVAVAVSA